MKYSALCTSSTTILITCKASYVIKVVVLDVKSALYFTGTLVAHRDVFRQI